MRHIDLFSGIGGFSLAAKWVWKERHEIVTFCEIDPFCQKVLKKHWPTVLCHDDIKTMSNNFKNIDLISGGFPCQDISTAGKGAGIDGKKSGLWREMFRVISGVRPNYVIVENSAAMLIRGGTRVLGDLASIGYDAEWQIIPAKEIGAPHERRRIFIIAYPHKVNGQKGMGIVLEEATVFEADRNERAKIWIQTPSPSIRMDDGIPKKLYRHSVEAFGNAIVPQTVVPIMQAIKEIN